jgi:putative SOS response-associated peptidase YedK
MISPKTTNSGFIAPWVKHSPSFAGDLHFFVSSTWSPSTRSLRGIRARLRQSRHALPADGFYERRRAPAGTTPYTIEIKDAAPSVLGGLWEACSQKGWLTRFVLHGIPSPKSERVRRTWIPTTSLLTHSAPYLTMTRP